MAGLRSGKGLELPGNIIVLLSEYLRLDAKHSSRYPEEWGYNGFIIPLTRLMSIESI